MRRVAALAVVSGLGIAMLAPLNARAGAVPEADPVMATLLDAARIAPRLDVDRGAPGRNASAAMSLMALHAAVTVEDLSGADPLPTPAALDLRAGLHAVSTPRPAPPVVTPPPSGASVTGRATWYCCTNGYRGQAVMALAGALGGHYDPSPSWYVTVCADRCVSLPVVDYCGCYWGTAQQKVADLSPEAWAAVTDTPRSAGVVQVTIHLGE